MVMFGAIFERKKMEVHRYDMGKEDKLNYWILVFVLTIAGLLISQIGLAQDKWDRVISLHGKWKFNIGDKALWSDRYYNDSKWETVWVPSKWEDEGFNGYDGYAWYRTTFNGADLKSKDLNYNLVLGYIDDVDEVFVNGKKIGSSGGFPPRYHTAYNALRNYVLPKELIDFTGTNVIAIRVFDEGIEGGIVSGDVGIYTNRTDRDLAINLRGLWEFKITGRRNDRHVIDERAAALQMSPAETDAWVDISVPGVRENQGYNQYDGSAWYKRQFMIPKSMSGQDLVLLLGKIDDSDRTFLNGKLVGSMTNAHDQLRIYHLTPEQFKAGVMNTLLVYVDDPQGLGGTHEGPVGLMRQVDFTRYIRWK